MQELCLLFIYPDDCMNRAYGTKLHAGGGSRVGLKSNYTKTFRAYGSPIETK